MEVLSTSQQFVEALEGLDEGQMGVLYVTAAGCKKCAQLARRWKAWVDQTDRKKVKFWSFDLKNIGVGDDDEADLSVTEYIGLTPQVPHVQVYRRQLGLSVIAHQMTGAQDIEKRLPAILAEAVVASAD